MEIWKTYWLRLHRRTWDLLLDGGSWGYQGSRGVFGTNLETDCRRLFDGGEEKLEDPVSYLPVTRFIIAVDMTTHGNEL